MYLCSNLKKKVKVCSETSEEENSDLKCTLLLKNSKRKFFKKSVYYPKLQAIRTDVASCSLDIFHGPLSLHAQRAGPSFLLIWLIYSSVKSKADVK